MDSVYIKCSKLLKYAVPQWSVLGPLLFTTYITDLTNCDFSGDIILYIDNTMLFCADSMDTMLARAQDDADIIYSRIIKNRM